MHYRLGRKDRPEWENPYFYQILMGDIQLSRGQPDEALAMYQEAEKNGVDAMFDIYAELLGVSVITAIMPVWYQALSPAEKIPEGAVLRWVPVAL